MTETNQRGPYQEIQDLVNYLNGTPDSPPGKKYMWWEGRSWYLQLLKVIYPPIIFDYMYKLNNGDPTTPREPYELRDDVFWMLVALFEKPKHPQKEIEIEQFLTKIRFR